MFYLTKHDLAKVGVAGSSLVFRLQPTLKGACVKFACGCKGLEGGAVQSKYILRQFHGYSWWQMQAGKTLLPNDWGSMWLGNIVRLLKKDWEKVYCRGWITDFNLRAPDRIDVSVESAWGELSEVRQLVLNNSESLRIFYQSEEPGMCIFQTNDTTGTYFPERWLLDWNDEARNLYIYEYFQDLPAVIDYLKNHGVITKDIAPTKEVINAVLSEIENSRPDDISFMFEEFEVVED